MEVFLGIALLIVLLIVVLLLLKSKQGGDGELKKQVDHLAIELAKALQREQSLLAERKELKAELDEERENALIAERTLESTKSYYLAQHEKLEEQKGEIEVIKKQFNTEFQVIANRILEEKTAKFTESNQLSMSQILDPLKEKIKSFEDKVDKTYQVEAAERNSLKGVVQQLMEQSLKIKDEANNLTRALKGDSKKQGNWGEVILERVLERSGLQKDQEYRLQVSYTDEAGRRMQPDAIIDLPDEKHLVVDSKVSLVAYEKWVNAETDEERILYARQHVISVENHVKDLSAKNYQDIYQIHSPDFVLLFMPTDRSIGAAYSGKKEI